MVTPGREEHIYLRSQMTEDGFLVVGRERKCLGAEALKQSHGGIAHRQHWPLATHLFQCPLTPSASLKGDRRERGDGSLGKVLVEQAWESESGSLA